MCIMLYMCIYVVLCMYACICVCMLGSTLAGLAFCATLSLTKLIDNNNNNNGKCRFGGAIGAGPSAVRRFANREAKGEWKGANHI